MENKEKKTMPELAVFENVSRFNLSEVTVSSWIACYHCLEINDHIPYSPLEVVEKKTVLCPKCGIDSVIAGIVFEDFGYGKDDKEVSLVLRELAEKNFMNVIQDVYPRANSKE